MDSEASSYLCNLSECEKAKILQVLKRNNQVMNTEDRRVWQLAVREQIERMADYRTLRQESELKVRTGEWHKELVRQRGQSTDLPSALYKMISSDLATSEKRHGENTLNPSIQSPFHKSLFSRPFASNKISTRQTKYGNKSTENNKDDIEMDMPTIKAWVENQSNMDSKSEKSSNQRIHR